MLCQKCKKNNATIYYKENINGKVTEYMLCGDCAKELEQNGVIRIENPLGGLFSDKLFDFSPLLSGFFGNRDRTLTGTQTDKHCPVCGSSFADIARTGQIGCPECYETFADELAATVNRLHGSAKPSGRIPKRFGEKHNREMKLAALKSDLQNAISTQEFERAAELRDQIKALEAEINTVSDAENTGVDTGKEGA